MRARALLVAIVSTSVAACGLATDDPNGAAATPLPVATTTSLPSTTTTITPRSGLTYDAELLDGGMLTIEEGVGELSEFTSDKPTAIHELDQIAAIPDCDALGVRIWDWTSRVDTTDTGQKASAYAKHGDNLYKFLGCGTPDAPRPPTTTSED
jgi:hypothetical protein